MLQDVFSIALMDETSFQNLVDQILGTVSNGELGREVERQFKLSSIHMKCAVKRSARLEYQGMKIKRVDIE